jgi:hypothetical protein
MEKYFTLILLLAWRFAYAQTPLCDCSAALNRDLTTQHINTQYHQLKDWLYTYFKSDATTEQYMKSHKDASWTSSASAIIDELPVKGQGDAAYHSDDEHRVTDQINQIFQQNGYLTDEQFNQILTVEMSANQLEAYKACLQTCGGGGVTYTTGGDLNDVLYIQVNFNSSTGGVRITLNGDALHDNLEPLNGLILKNGYVINDRQSVTQYFKRLDPTKSASFSFNVKENVAVAPVTFPAAPTVNTTAMPIGTIVASVLPYGDFLEVNGYTYTGDMGKAVWVPCDGRLVGSSKYAHFGAVPDLRGLFLRGANDFGVIYEGVAVVDDAHKNPDNTHSGVFQQDAFQSHNHGMGVALGPFGTNYTTVANVTIGDARLASPSQVPINNSVIQNAGGSSETRPKNMTVFYYIKIN